MAVVTIDPVNLLLIEISVGGDNAISWAAMYLDWKEWQLADYPARAGYPIPFVVSGGEPTGGGFLGATFFLMNRWRFRPAELSHNVTIAGNVWTDPDKDQEPPFVPTVGPYTVGVSYWQTNLVNTVAIGSGVLASDITAIGAEVEGRILSDGQAFAGANVDAAVSSRAAPGQGLTAGQATSLSNAEAAAAAAQAAAEAIDLATLEEQMTEVRQRLALDPASPLVVNKTTLRQSIPADGSLIDIVATDDGTDITYQRQP